MMPEIAPPPRKVDPQELAFREAATEVLARALLEDKEPSLDSCKTYYREFRKREIKAYKNYTTFLVTTAREYRDVLGGKSVDELTAKLYAVTGRGDYSQKALKHLAGELIEGVNSATKNNKILGGERDGILKSNQDHDLEHGMRAIMSEIYSDKHRNLAAAKLDALPEWRAKHPELDRQLADIERIYGKKISDLPTTNEPILNRMQSIRDAEIHSELHPISTLTPQSLPRFTRPEPALAV